MAKKKFYVVWEGHSKGVFKTWEECKKQIDGFKGAKYKSFATLEMAKEAFRNTYEDYKGTNTTKKLLTEAEKLKYGSPILESISVDAACGGNPGVLEYRGVDTKTKKQLFLKGPFDKGTNNIGEFLALVHGLALLKSKNMHDLPIYSDSKIAMGWVKVKQCRTNLQPNSENKELFDLVKRAEVWLKNNTYKNPILKWETKAWGEIPADFGRK